jgi:GNAT superfamily N-acetyltransferase
MDLYLAWRIACWPDMPMDPDEFWEEWQARPPDIPCERWLWMDQGEVVLAGVAHCEHWVGEPGLYYVGVLSTNNSGPVQVAECYRSLMDWSLERGANRFVSWSRSTMTVDQGVLREIGFVETQRNPESHLDLTSFETRVWQEAIDGVRAKGYEFFTYRQWADRKPEDFVRETWELEQDLIFDVPRVERVEKVPFEEYKSQIARDEPYWDTMWLAVINDRLVAASQHFPAKTRKGHVSTGLSGTRREARRNGIITALKAHALGDLKARGMTLVTTDNEEANPMFQINVRLGFRKVYDHIAMSFHPEVNKGAVDASLEVSRADRPDSSQLAES